MEPSMETTSSVQPIQITDAGIWDETNNVSADSAAFTDIAFESLLQRSEPRCTHNTTTQFTS